MTRAHLDAPPRRLVQADTFSKEGQRWSWDFVLLLPIRDEDALQDAPKRQQDVDITDAAGLVGDLVMQVRDSVLNVARRFTRPRTQAQKPKDPLVLKYTLKKVASSIKQAGLDVCVFKSRDYDRAVVKVRATVGRLRKHAAQTGFVAKLRDREVKDRLRRGLEDVDAPGEYKIYPRCAAASFSLAAARRRREASRRWRRGDAVSRRWRRRDLAPRRRDNWTYKGVPMDTSIRDTEGRAPLYLYYEHCYGPFVDREDARRLYEKYPRF